MNIYIYEENISGFVLTLGEALCQSISCCTPLSGANAKGSHPAATVGSQVIMAEDNSRHPTAIAV